MLIYKDKLSGDEMFTDSFPVELEEGGQVYKIKGKYTTETTDVDESCYGGNKSAEAEGDDEGADASSVSGINVVLQNRLVETGFGSKKEYQAYIKGYMKSVVKKMEEDGVDEADIDEFKKGAASFVKKVSSEFKEYQFFMGESMKAEASLAYVKWDGETPYVYFIKAALEEEKV